MLAGAAWTGMRDALATLGACTVGYLGTLLAREACRAEPPLHLLFSGVNAIAVGVTAYAFSTGAGTEGWHPRRRWIGGGTAIVCTGLTLYATYSGPDPDAWTKKATSFFGTLVYSMARELMQNQARRVFPEFRLDPQRALHWETGRNTCKHVARVSAGSAIYATSSVLLNGLARQSIISSNFGDMDQAMGLFTRDSWRTFTLRAINEGLDGFTGTLLLAAFFRADLQPGNGFCSNQCDDPRATLVRAGSRVSMNLTVNAIQALIPSNHASIVLLQGITGFRGALQSAKLRQAGRGHPVHAPTDQELGHARRDGTGDRAEDREGGQVVPRRLGSQNRLVNIEVFGGASDNNTVPDDRNPTHGQPGTPRRRHTPTAQQGLSDNPWNPSQMDERTKKDQ